MTRAEDSVSSHQHYVRYWKNQADAVRKDRPLLAETFETAETNNEMAIGSIEYIEVRRITGMVNLRLLLAKTASSATEQASKHGMSADHPFVLEMERACKELCKVANACTDDDEEMAKFKRDGTKFIVTGVGTEEQEMARIPKS